jgi:hypothetical protein
MAQAGITQGCNPPANTRFCPDNPVTRGQMAGFLRRAIEDALVLPDTPLVNLELVAWRTRPSIGAFELNGRTYNNSVMQDTQGVLSGPDYAEYLLGRDYTDFCAVVGVWDKTDDDQIVNAEITLDGEIVWNETIELGSLMQVDIPVEGALRLRLSIRDAAVNPRFVYAGWGSPVVAQDGECDVPTGFNPPSPSLVYLADLGDIAGDSNPTLGATELNGTLYPRSVVQRTQGNLDEITFNTYYLGRDYARFCAVVGVPDDYDEAMATAQVEVLGDGVSIGSELVAIGDTATFNLNVSGVLRLDLVTSDGSTPTTFTQGGWGNARITKTAC